MPSRLVIRLPERTMVYATQSVAGEERALSEKKF